MVLRDPFEKPRKALREVSEQVGHSALPLDRMASHIADLILLMPLMALAMAPFRRAVAEARLLDRVFESDWALIQGVLAAIAVGVVWETVFLSLWGTTPGRAIFGLRVVDVWTQERPRVFNAFLRGLTWWGSLLFLGAPFFGVYGNTKRRPLHDRVGDTEVRSGNTRRRSSPPHITELAFGSLFTTATVFFAAIVILSQVAILREHAQRENVSTEPKLCEDVSVALEDWETKDASKPPRISVALSLSAAGFVDSGCLHQEADYALWNNQGRLLGYLAKGLIQFGEDGEEAESYFAKVCDLEPDSDACRLVGWYRSLETSGAKSSSENGQSEEGEVVASDSDSASEVSNPQSTEKIESIARGILGGRAPASNQSGPRQIRAGTAAPDWLRLLVLREMFIQRADPEMILQLTQDPGKHLTVGAKLVEYRARAQWRLGLKREAKSTVFAAADALPRRQRVVLASWLCNRELYESSCSPDASRACDLMERAADAENGDFSVPSFLVASIRHAECRIEKRRGTTSLLSSIADNVEEANGRLLIESIRMLRSSDRQKGLDQLRKLASLPDSSEDLFVTEANIRLVEELSHGPRDSKVEKEIGELRERWHSSRGAKRYADWGRALFEALSRRGDWKKAAEVGSLIGADFEFDRTLQGRIAVAAWRGGKLQYAAEIVDSMEKSRFPASLDDDEPRSADSQVLEAIKRSGRRR